MNAEEKIAQLEADIRAAKAEIRRQATKIASLLSPNRDLTFLHPVAFTQFTNLAMHLSDAYSKGDTRTHFRPFEGYRSPARQAHLMNQHPPVTKAGMWESAHQFGLAVDFVAFDGFQWSWNDREDWLFLQRSARTFGLHVPIAWDKAHVQHPAWDRSGERMRRP